MSTILTAMSLVLMFSAAAPQASAGAVRGALQIPTNDSLAHCIPRCGDADIWYPFGVGSGCFRQGFELTCDHSTKPPKLFLGSSTIVLTAAYSDAAVTPIFFNLTTEPGTNTYNMSWESPAEGITLGVYNTLFVAGCDFDVTLFESGTGDIVGSCMSRCAGKKAPTGVPCNGIGCCFISLQRDLPGFRAKLVSTNTTATQSDWLHPGIMAFVADDEYYKSNTTSVFSAWTNLSSITVRGAYLRFTIMDQPSCERAQMNYATYACSNDSICQNFSTGGYQCSCSSYYSQGNPYILDGCVTADYYNPKPKEQCRSSCGPITVPFPFGLEEGCSANERFLLNCTSGNLTLSVSIAQYHVTDVSVEDGTLTVSNMVSGSNAKEVMLIQTDNTGYEWDEEALMEDRFDFSMEYDIVIKWAVANLTCQTAMQKDTGYACRSSHSYCLNVTHGEIFMGYRCKCSPGFQGNPYIKDNCTGLILLITLHCALLLLSYLQIFRKTIYLLIDYILKITI
ncbi:wall-associated receptor kinase 5-like [Lolium rigidum]|uniref:wall-associated receptor kinase 5-like n=1 Tax=Lolium rigidum TaxID=89674 RepID=UPI001F5E2F32|nr:wall-associated receptor kinase 5-like [Lolium rigidum]